jgi:hypothetical protein
MVSQPLLSHINVGGLLRREAIKNLPVPSSTKTPSRVEDDDFSFIPSRVHRLPPASSYAATRYRTIGLGNSANLHRINHERVVYRSSVGKFLWNLLVLLSFFGCLCIFLRALAGAGAGSEAVPGLADRVWVANSVNGPRVLDLQMDSMDLARSYHPASDFVHATGNPSPHDSNMISKEGAAIPHISPHGTHSISGTHFLHRVYDAPRDPFDLGRDSDWGDSDWNDFDDTAYRFPLKIHVQRSQQEPRRCRGSEGVRC